jgi:hypothetical protein
VNKQNPLRPGESPLNNAPAVVLDNGRACIPQHYLQFQHSLDSLENLVADINYSPRYPIFVCEEKGQLYLQVGIVGFDNYDKTPCPSSPPKIVYGRKWRVELELPTSEIIQSAFLAIKKAREHEIRELFRVFCDGRYSTPFNNHHDLPLMAQNEELLAVQAQRSNLEDILLALAQIQYDGASFKFLSLKKLRGDCFILDLEINNGPTTSLPELKSRLLSLMLASMDINELFYELMDALVKRSDRHVEEHFTYQNYARFSRRCSIEALGKLSKHLRQGHSANAEFVQQFSHANYQTDLTRVPQLGEGRNAQKIRSQLANFKRLEGIPPKRCA